MDKLTIFTNHYFPESFRINALSKEFTKHYQVNVISQVPNYPKGRFFKGYSNFKNKKEDIDNIEVQRLPIIPRGSNVIMLSLNYISYLISSLIYSKTSKEKTDHVLVYITSPIFIAYAGLAFAKKNKVKSSLYLLDLWPGSLISMLNIKNKYIINKLEKMCISIYKQFDNIIVASSGFIEVLESYGIKRSKISYIPQHADEILDKPISIKPIIDKIKIVFTGNIGVAQGLDTLVEASTILKAQKFNKVIFTIVGDGRYKNQLVANVKNKQVEDFFEFKGRVDASKIKSILEDNHFGFVSLSDDETLNKTLPAKVQSYMAYGIPILACANGEIPLFLNKTKSGISVKANNAKELAQAIVKLEDCSSDELIEMSNNGFNYSRNNFDLAINASQIIKIMKEGK